MPAWGEILAEINQARSSGNPLGLDTVRRKYLIALRQKRGRAVILYATKWTQPSNASPDMVSITDEDLQALMTVLNGIHDKNLDLIMHSPGGSLEAAEAFVTYIRSKFENICVIVPQQAMSAAAMIACSANKVMLGKHSFLGPTDPQFILNTELGQRVVSAQNIEEQFERAQKECADPSKIGAWIPLLKQYGPDMLQKCKNASNLSNSLVAGWLQQYMFAGHDNAEEKAKKIATWLSSHENFKTHGRHLSRDDLRARGLDIVDLEEDAEVQDLVLSVFHATTLTFDQSPSVKLVENHLGKAFVKMVQQQPVFQIAPNLQRKAVTLPTAPPPPV